MLRQLLNQESLLRINTNNELQELKKALEGIQRDTKQINASLVEATTFTVKEPLLYVNRK